MSDNLEKQDLKTAESSSLEAGAVFESRYQIISLLGSGATGTVYRVNDTILNRELALKLIHKSLLSEPASIERFRHEAQSGKSFQHPNLAKVYSAGMTADGRLYMVMDYLEGECLADKLEREKKLSLPTFFEIFLQIIDGLGYLHKQGIVHRDLKPKNILLVETAGDLKVFIVDFGLAKYIYQSGSQKNTQTGQLLGTSAYMSPEQCQGNNVDQRSDIYSLACLMLECLVGQTPFQGASPMDIMYKHINESLGKLSFLKSLPSPLAKILGKCLQKRPENRYQTLDELKIDLLYCSQMQDTLQRKLHRPEEQPSAGLRKQHVLVLGLISASLLGLVLFSQQGREHKKASDKYLSSQKKGKPALEPARTVKLRPTQKSVDKLLDDYAWSPDEYKDLYIIKDRWMAQYWNTDRATADQQLHACRRFADFLLRLEDFKGAQDMFAKLEVLSAGADQFHIAKLACQAQVLRKSGEIEKAVSAADQALADYKNSTQPRTPAVYYAASLAAEAKADTYFAIDEYQKAAPVYYLSLELRRQQVGLVGLDNGPRVGPLFICYFKTGKTQKIKDLEKQLKLGMKTLKSPTNTDANIYGTIAQAAFKTGHFEEAIEYFRKMLDQCKIENRDPPEADAYVFIAESLFRLKRYEEGFKEFKTQLDSVPIDQAPRRLSFSTRMSRVYLEKKDTVNAVKLMERATREFRESRFGSSNNLSSCPDVSSAVAFATYCLALRQNNESEKAEKFLKDLIAEIRQDCPVAAELNMALGDLYCSKNSWDDSISCLRKALEFWEAPGILSEFKGLTKADVNDRIALAKYTLLQPLLKTKRYEEALTFCHDILHCANQNTMWMHEPCLNYEAGVYLQQKKYELARSTYKKMELSSDQHNKNSPASAAAYLNDYLSFELEQRNFAEAERLYRKTIGYLNEAYGKDSAHLIASYVGIAKPLVAQGKYDDAVGFLQEGLRICKKNKIGDYQKEIFKKLISYNKTRHKQAAVKQFTEELQRFDSKRLVQGKE